jgi:dTDP-4-amino-4,6-dideoxygalactose transaminase
MLPQVLHDADPVWHLFVIRHPCRDELQKRLLQQGISTLIHYPVAPHLAGAYSALGYRADSFPIAERLAATALSLPIGPQQLESSTSNVISALQTICNLEVKP